MSLAAAFWGFYVIGWIPVIFIALFIRFAFESTANLPGAAHWKGLGFGISFVLFWIYMIIAVVGVWRSAARYQGSRLWSFLARLAVAIWIGRVLLWLGDGHALKIAELMMR